MGWYMKAPEAPSGWNLVSRPRPGYVEVEWGGYGETPHHPAMVSELPPLDTVASGLSPAGQEAIVKGLAPLGLAVAAPLVGGVSQMVSPLIKTAIATGTALVAERAGIGVPGVEVQWPEILPGGLPFVTREPPGVSPVRKWSTGTTIFLEGSDGSHWVLTKKGWKKYRRRKPIVLGTKHLTPRKMIRANRLYTKLMKDLARGLGYKVKRGGYRRRKR